MFFFCPEPRLNATELPCYHQAFTMPLSPIHSIEFSRACYNWNKGDGWVMQSGKMFCHTSSWYRNRIMFCKWMCFDTVKITHYENTERIISYAFYYVVVRESRTWSVPVSYQWRHEKRWSVITDVTISANNTNTVQLHANSSYLG